MICAKLPFSDAKLEHFIECYYKIPHFRRGNTCKRRGRPIIISLTTIPSRLDKVWLTTESLLRQTKKPNKIILWLAEDEFQGVKIPKMLKKQKKRGLEIRYCGNLKSYKKFYYTMLEYPDAYVLVVDDDFVYSERMLEKMISVSSRHPGSIVSNRAHKIRNYKNELFPYRRWIWYENRKIIEEIPSFRNFLTGCGGVLFPVWLLDREIFRKDIFMKIAPTADDVWVNFSAWKSKIKVVVPKGILGYMIPIHSSSDTGLFLKNTVKKTESDECENDFQIRNVLEYFNLDINEYIDEGKYVEK